MHVRFVIDRLKQSAKEAPSYLHQASKGIIIAFPDRITVAWACLTRFPIRRVLLNGHWEALKSVAHAVQ